jgi:hypothetical protein
MAHAITSIECPYCGKKFCPAPYHNYSCTDGEKQRLLCSWTCMLRYEEKRDAQKRANAEKRRKKKE